MTDDVKTPSGILLPFATPEEKSQHERANKETNKQVILKRIEGALEAAQLDASLEVMICLVWYGAVQLSLNGAKLRLCMDAVQDAYNFALSKKTAPGQES